MVSSVYIYFFKYILNIRLYIVITLLFLGHYFVVTIIGGNEDLKKTYLSQPQIAFLWHSMTTFAIQRKIYDKKPAKTGKT